MAQAEGKTGEDPKFQTKNRKQMSRTYTVASPMKNVQFENDLNSNNIEGYL